MAKNYCVDSENEMSEEGNVFADSKKKVEELKKTLLMPNGKDSADSLYFISILFSLYLFSNRKVKFTKTNFNYEI